MCLHIMVAVFFFLSVQLTLYTRANLTTHHLQQPPKRRVTPPNPCLNEEVARGDEGNGQCVRTLTDHRNTDAFHIGNVRRRRTLRFRGGLRDTVGAMPCRIVSGCCTGVLFSILKSSWEIRTVIVVSYTRRGLTTRRMVVLMFVVLAGSVGRPLNTGRTVPCIGGGKVKCQVSQCLSRHHRTTGTRDPTNSDRRVACKCR